MNKKQLTQELKKIPKKYRLTLAKINRKMYESHWLEGLTEVADALDKELKNESQS